MPSPFPGMDPYLEHPVLWPGVHQNLITFINVALNASLPPRYFANIGERIYVVQSERPIYPEVAVFEAAPASAQSGTMEGFHSRTLLPRNLFLKDQKSFLQHDAVALRISFPLSPSLT
jgi:hypothetical protein